MNEKMNKKICEAFLKFLNENDFQKRIDSLAKKYKGKRIILYGAGIISDVLTNNFDISSLNIIGISDIKFELKNESETQNCTDYKIIKPSEIIKNKPDVVLIFLQEYFRAEDYFKKELMPKYGKFKYDSVLKISIFSFIKYKIVTKFRV